VNDPSSYTYFGWGRETSGIEVPEPGVDFYDVKEGVSHGEVRARWYHSQITGKWRRACAEGIGRHARADQRVRTGHAPGNYSHD
jgi:hypothetical protein